MLGYAITFLIIALVAALLGFTGIAIISVEIARILFIVFIVLFLVSLIFGMRMRRRPPDLSRTRSCVRIGLNLAGDNSPIEE